MVAVACSSRAPAPASAPPARATELERAPDAELGKRVDAVIDQALGAQKIVGTVVLIARDGKLVYARAAGHADREAKLAMREDTQFRLASMTKPIVSAAALALVDRKQLALEDPVTKYLPDFQPKLADGTTPVITVRHLITHTSGLGYTFLEPAGGPYHTAKVSSGLAEPGLPAAANLRRLASAPLWFAPGTKWQYGLSIDVLGEVIARAAGRPLPDVVGELVTRPLAMTSTTFTVTDRARLAWPYGAGKRPARMTEPYTLAMDDLRVTFSPARIFDPASFPSGGAGMAGTASDYLRFLEAIRTGGAPILAPATAAAMHANQIDQLEADILGPGQRFGFGFGVITDATAEPSARGTGSFGWGGIYGTDFWVDPEAKLSVVVMTNTAGDTGFTSKLEQAIYAR